MEWTITDKYLKGVTKKFKLGNKIASFDLDQTLIDTKSGKKFPQNSDDWEWLYDNTVDKLKELHNNNYTIIIISNQAGISSGKQSGEEWMKKLDKIVKKINFELMVLCSTDKNEYRKPLTRMREDFLPLKMDKESFYCGDAVGRKKDFSDTDYKFALNININFFTPEHLFLGKKNELPKIIYPIDLTKKNKNIDYDFKPNKKEIIIMMGFPGSGKSTFSKMLNEKYNYIIINQDTLKTKAKCKKETIKQLENNKCVIIDATNPSKSTRGEWIDIAKNYNYKIRIVKIDEDIETAKHKNIYRSLTTNTKRVPDIGYNMYKSKYDEPSLEEGVEEILLIPGNPPNDPKYYMYLS